MPDGEYDRFPEDIRPYMVGRRPGPRIAEHGLPRLHWLHAERHAASRRLTAPFLTNPGNAHTQLPRSARRQTSPAPSRAQKQKNRSHPHPHWAPHCCSLCPSSRGPATVSASTLHCWRRAWCWLSWRRCEGPTLLRGVGAEQGVMDPSHCVCHPAARNHHASMCAHAPALVCTAIQCSTHPEHPYPLLWPCICSASPSPPPTPSLRARPTPPSSPLHRSMA